VGGPTQSLAIDLTPEGSLVANVMYYLSQDPRVPIIIYDGNGEISAPSMGITSAFVHNEDQTAADVAKIQQTNGHQGFGIITTSD
jgi:hypothetical protein